jgi:molecular chaperone DnaK
MVPARPSSAAVGIDLGTSNTVVAHADSASARALADDVGRDVLLPSVCAFHPSGAVVVGREAKARRLQDPKNTIFSAKRLIGRPWGTKEVAQARARLPYDLRQGKNASVLVAVRGKEYTLPEVSAFILRKAKATAEVALACSVDRAVVTCPANFDDLQRGATKLAGKLAGLQVLRILNEPTAAALAYGYGKAGEELILVYDFGGGTFDVSVLVRQGDFFQVRATAGDSYLGGDDIDAAVANRMAEAFAAKHFYDPRADSQVFEQVRAAAEEIKVRLAVEERASLELSDIAFGAGGKTLPFDFAMTRAELGAIVDPFVERTFRVCRHALEQAAVDVRQVDQILLVGGSTLVPRVRERVSELFGREPAAGVSPFEAVAVGAAIQAHAMSEVEEDESGVPSSAALAAARKLIDLRPAPSTPSRAPVIEPLPAPAPVAAPVVNVPEALSAPVLSSGPSRFVIEKAPSEAPAPRARTWIFVAAAAALALLAWLVLR